MNDLLGNIREALNANVQCAPGILLRDRRSAASRAGG